MKQFIFVVLWGFICTQLTGCSGWAVRTSSSHKPRIDQEIAGNRGFIFGKPTSAVQKPTFTDRKVYRVEVEMPQWRQQEKSTPTTKKSKIRPRRKDVQLWGNRGYISGGPKEKVVPESNLDYEVDKEMVLKTKPKTAQILEKKPKRIKKIATYKVNKGDTLQKIANKFYGTTKKWTLIYQANKDKLKSPNRVYPGQVLTIPEIAEYKK